MNSDVFDLTWAVQANQVSILFEETTGVNVAEFVG